MANSSTFAVQKNPVVENSMIKPFFLITLLMSFPFLLQAASPDIVEVYGIADMEPLADNFQIYLEISIRDRNRGTVNSRYNKVYTNLKNLLAKLGIKKQRIITESLFSSEWREWEHNSYRAKGWRLRHSMSLKLENLDLTGRVLSKLSSVNDVSIRNIRYSLSRTARKKFVNDLYSAAYHDAMLRVNALLRAMKKKLLRVSLITEDLSSPRTPYNKVGGAPRMAGLKSATRNARIELSPRKIPLNLKLKLQAQYR